MSQLTFDIPISNSSLISGIDYDEDKWELRVHFHKYYTAHLTYEEFPAYAFDEFIRAKSKGQYFLNKIKPIYKLKTQNMADEKKKPTGINVASDKKRFIKLRLDLSKINKDWLVAGKEGAIYCDMTLQMLPNEEVDRFENLGMVTQDVPTKIYKEDKKAKGEILGNGKELQWNNDVPDSSPGSGGDIIGAGSTIVDDLPF